jgi:dynein light chain Tctex-type 1
MMGVYSNQDAILLKLKQESASYKYIIYVTLLDHHASGPKGIRTTSGAYWNSEKDGMWNYKFEGTGVDAIISIAWIHSSS